MKGEMMIYKIETDNKNEMQLMLKADEMASGIYSIWEDVRRQLKYDEMSEETRFRVEKIYEQICEVCSCFEEYWV